MEYTRKELTEIYERHVEAVYRVCFLFLRNPSDAEDAVQTVFLKFMQSSKYFYSPEHEKAGLISTAKNLCKNSLKYWWHTRRTELPEGWEPKSPEATRTSGEITHKVLALPEKYRVALYLYYYEEYSVSEISQILHCNESTIRTRLSRAREKLKVDIGGTYSE